MVQNSGSIEETVSRMPRRFQELFQRTLKTPAILKEALKNAEEALGYVHRMIDGKKGYDARLLGRTL